MGAYGNDANAIALADAYYKWLGIPRNEQPANAYRLLGIAQFEPNADVIQAAADRQMAHIRTYQTGAQSALSQRILNELSAARICLLRPERRAKYDEQLRRELSRRAGTIGPPQRPIRSQSLPPELPRPNDSSTTESLLELLDDQPIPRPTASRKVASRGSGAVRLAMWGSIAVAGVALLAVTVAVVASRDQAPPSESVAASQPQAAAPANPPVAAKSERVSDTADGTTANSDQAVSPFPVSSEPKQIVLPAVADAPNGTAADSQPASAGQPPTQAPIVSPRAPENLADVVERTEDSVVRVDSSGDGFSATGSGFLVADGNIVVTNFHVVDGVNSVEVEFHDHTHAAVSGFLAAEPSRDLALLSLAPGGSPRKPIPLATKQPRQGDHVYAIGTPRGFSFTLSDGIVSAIRTVHQLDALGGAGEQLRPQTTLIQTTTPISPGNSGGPLINGSGEVVGVNFMSRIDAQNLNFAIAANEVSEVLSNRFSSPRPLQALPRVAHSNETVAGSFHGTKTHKSLKIGYEKIQLSSGRSLDVGEMFRDGITEHIRQLEQYAARGGSVFQSKPGSGGLACVASESRGVLGGLVISGYETGVPATYAPYTDGWLDGNLLTWREDGTRMLFGQYAKGRKNGFTCLFDANDNLRFVEEFNHDDPEWYYLIKGETVLKGFHVAGTTIQESEDLKSALADVSETLSKFKASERKIKKQVSQWDEQQRQALAAANSVAARKRIMDRENARWATNSQYIGTLRSWSGL